MIRKTLLVTLLAGVAISIYIATSPEVVVAEDVESSPQYKDGKFQNGKTLRQIKLKQIPGYLKRLLFEDRKDAQPLKPIPLTPIDTVALSSLADGEMSLFRLGHSSFLLKAADEFWLIDPVFSERASPFSFIGPKRFHPTPITIENLPNIRGVIISHNHYDHLDKSAIKKLAGKVQTFIVPLGIASTLGDWGIDEKNIIELDWWQSTTVGKLSLASTPAQHFSGRGLNDRNKTLWSSWVVKTQKQSLFYSGDSGYFNGFKKIGEKFGPFDMTIIETGAYDKGWPDVHMTPEQSLQAHLDVRGKKLLPAHNGTFDLAFHPWYEPLERITMLAREKGVDIVTPIVGEAVNFKEEKTYPTWWRGLN